MNPLERREIGDTGVRLTSIGLGGSAIGGEYSPTSDTEAYHAIEKALNLGIRYVDTAPLYGAGKSEARIGHFLAKERPTNLVISTKVGRILVPNAEGTLTPTFNFSREAVMQSVEGSLRRLGVDSVDILYIHDPDNHYQEAISQAYKALVELRDSGRVKAIGVGMNQWEMELRFAQEGDFDCFLQAGRYNLMDQSALDKFLPYCEDKGIGIISGAPFAYGVLAADLRPGAKLKRDVPALVLEKARKIDAICSKHDVPIKAASLQFILAHPAFCSVIPGSQTEDEVEENFDAIKYPIPRELWNELKQEKLIVENAITP